MQPRNYTLFAIFIVWANALAAQPLKTTENTATNDTIVTYVDYFGRPQSRQNATYERKVWSENGKYRMLTYEISSGNLTRKAWYADAACREMDGVFETFHPNGTLKDSGRYEHKKREGIFKSWHENGRLSSVQHFENGLAVDSGRHFNPEGGLSELSVADKLGNGTQTSFYPDGTIRQTGRLAGGKKDGTWTINREDGTRMMQVDFLSDSIIQTQCFGADGNQPGEGSCIFEKEAGFPGGMAGWRNFLVTKMVYPKEAIRNEIEGTVIVQFVIDKDGTLSDLKVISSPNDILSKEALRLMGQSPKWVPAIQWNREVKSVYRQPVYFKLQ